MNMSMWTGEDAAPGRGASSPPRGYGRAFAGLWAAVATSQLGSAVTTTLVPLIAAITLDASPAVMSGLVIAGIVPALLVRLPAAAWADSLRASGVGAMVVCNAGQAICVGAVPLLWSLGALTLPVLLAAVALGSLLTGVHAALSTPVLVEVVTPEHLVGANGRLTATRSAADIGGPAIGGLLVSVVAAPLVLLVDSVSFLVSAVLLTGVRSRLRRPAGAPEHRAADRASRGWPAGLVRRLVARRDLRTVMAVAFVNGTVETVLVLFMVDVLALPPGAIGLLLGLGAVGGVLGGALVGRIVAAVGTARTLTIGAASTAMSLVLLPASTGGATGAAGVVLFELAGSFGGTLLIATVFGTLQRDAPGASVARVMAVSTMALQVAGLAGAAAGGVLGTALGLRGTLAVASALLVLVSLPMLARWRTADPTREGFR
jgi:predicted MFS family arabinose efflux permease